MIIKIPKKISTRPTILTKNYQVHSNGHMMITDEKRQTIDVWFVRESHIITYEINYGLDMLIYLVYY